MKQRFLLLLAFVCVTKTELNAQGLLKKIKDKATQVTSGTSTPGNNSSGTKPDPSEGIAETGASTAKNKLPGGNTLVQKPLFSLSAGEFIIYNESSLHVSGPDGLTDYTIVTRSGREFFVTTSKGRQGPFKTVPAEFLPKRNEFQGNGIQQFEEVKANTSNSIGYTIEGKVLIKNEGKVLVTLPPGTQYMGHYLDKKTNRLVYLTMTVKDDKTAIIANQPSPKKNLTINSMVAQVLVEPSSGKILYQSFAEDITEKNFTDEDGNTVGPFPGNSKACALPGSNGFIVLVPIDGEGYKVMRDNKELYTVKSENNDEIFFNGDASQYCFVSYDGLSFSDGSRVATGILPVVANSAKGTLLYFLLVNEKKEVVKCSMPW